MEPPAPGAPLTAGLFGKLPAHGDFVRRGWADETVDAIDRWLTGTVAAVRAARDEIGFDAWMRAAPLWRGYVPPGALGPDALHLAVAASVDRAGRLFPIAAGVAGDADAVWRHAGEAGDALDGAIYDALSDGLEADATVATIAASIDVGAAGAAESPVRSVWWLGVEGAPAVESEAVDAALLERLLGEGQAGGGQAGGGRASGEQASGGGG